MGTLKDKLSELQITITPKQIKAMLALEHNFRLYRTNIMVFNGPYLGVYPISFKTSDTNALYHLFEVDPVQIRELIRQIPAINTDFNVQSDPFNVLCFWLMHLAFLYIDKERTRYEFMTAVCKYFHYRVFTSTVNNSFRVGAIKSVMDAALASMSKKPDIIRYESWGAIIDKHVEHILSPSSDSYRIIKNASPDKDFAELAGKAQTAIRNKIVGFAVVYYDVFKKGDRIRTTSSLSETADGERIIAQTASVIDTTMNAMVTDVLSPHTWLSERDIVRVASQFTAITPAMLRNALTTFSEEAAKQSRQRTLDKILPARGDRPVIYVGIRVFLFELIRSSLRFCDMRQINPGRKLEMFNELRDTYASSRNQDPDVRSIKESVTYFFDKSEIGYSDTARPALRLAVIQYILMKMLYKM